MADEDVSTRAPESDAAAQQSAIPGDTVVDQGASMGVGGDVAMPDESLANGWNRSIACLIDLSVCHVLHVLIGIVADIIQPLERNPQALVPYAVHVSAIHNQKTELKLTGNH